MSTIRFGKACDGEGCSTRYNNYDVGDILPCDDCLLDLCKPCRDKTGHTAIREEVCCQDCPGPAAVCPA